PSPANRLSSTSVYPPCRAIISRCISTLVTSGTVYTFLYVIFMSRQSMSLMTLLRRLRFSARPKLCENIIWWALDRGWQTQIIHEPFQLRLSPPVGCEEDSPAHARFKPYCNVGFNAQYLVTIPSASIRSVGLCRTPDGEFVLESVWRPQ